MRQTIRVFCGVLAAGAITAGLIYQPPNEAKTRSDNFWLLCMLVAGIGMLLFLWLGRDPLNPKFRPTPEDRLRHNVQRVSSLLIVGFILITVQLLRMQFVQANEIEKPYIGEGDPVQDPRQVTAQLANQRGRIFDAAGNEVAGIATSKYNLVRRTYAANSPVKQLLGYFSPLQFGNSGLEARYDDYLSGTGGNPLANLQRDLLHQPIVGDDLYLTIDPKLQQVAQDALGQTPGAIVLLDARTGAVLAMVGYPRYDPAELAFDPTQDDSTWNDQNKAITAKWKALNSDPSLPLLMRPTQGLYTPGSIFKTITLAGMLDSGKATPDTSWNDQGFYIVDNHRINDPNRPNQNTTWSSKQGYMFSLNSVFAQMGLQLGAQGLRDYTAKFGFGKDIPFDMAVSQSSAENQGSPNYLDNRVAQAETGFGQGQLQVTPLHMALMAAAMGRGDGVMPKPYIVQSIKTRAGGVVKQTQPNQTWLQTVRTETTGTVRDIMVASATQGWVGLNGGNLPSTKAQIGGKTGTAELGNGINNAWYIAWASKGDRLFAIAALVDHKQAGEGLRDAMPRADQVLTAALASVK